MYQPPMAVQVTDLASGLLALVDKPALKTQLYAEQQLRAVRTGAHPSVILFERKFVTRMAAKHGIPLFAHNMVRTPEEQTALFVRGVTKARGGESPHNYGLAVDIVHSRRAWDISPEGWKMLGHIGKEVAASLGIKVVWGGDWNFYDPAHWELANWKEMKQWQTR